MKSKISSFFLYMIIFSFFLFLFLRPNKIVLASTPTGSPPPVSDSPDPQYGGGTITFSCSGCSAASGETIKLYICKASDCGNCKIIKTNAPSNPSFTAYGSYSSYATQNNPGNTLNEDNVWGNISVYDAWNNQDVGGNWTWDFGSSITGTFRIKWFARVTGDFLPSYCVDVFYGIYISNDGSTWTAVRTGEFYHAAGAGAWSPYTSVYIESVAGTYRYVRASIYSTASCMVNSAELWVDVVSVDTEITSNCWAVSPAVSSGPSTSYTCPSCTYATNTYYGITCSQQEHPATCSAITSALTFTCKKENGCACSAGECYNDCKADPDGVGAWCCYSNNCAHDGSCYYPLVELSSPGASACILGENIAHNTAGTTNYRYAVYDGQLYYCGTSNSDTSPYTSYGVTNLIPGDKIGLCQCNWDGSWSCTGVIGIRRGRIKIV
jgi:hypothetical protein